MKEPVEGKMSPRAQRLVLRAFYDFDSWSGAGTAQAAKLLGKPKFTAMRAFDELASIDPSLVKAEGKVRWLTPGADRKSFLKKVGGALFNPVIREYRLKRIPATGRLPLSGLSAIRHHANLEKPPFPTFAITKAQERELGLRNGEGLAGWDQWEDPACVAHVMRYQLDSMGETAIDPLSAILSLSEDEMGDRQVEQAAISILTRLFSAP